MSGRSPDTRTAPTLCHEVSSSTECKSSSPAPTPSPASICKRLDLLLDGLTSSTSPSPSPSLEPSSSPSNSYARSEMQNVETCDATDSSSETDAEDVVRYTEKQLFHYGDEASDGYEDEDKSMTSSEEEQLGPGKGTVNLGTKPSNLKEMETCKVRDVTSDTVEDMMNIPHHDQVSPTDDVNIACRGPQMAAKELQGLRKTIEHNLANEWENQGLHPPATAEEDRYDTGAVAEALLIDDQQNPHGHNGDISMDPPFADGKASQDPAPAEATQRVRDDSTRRGPSQEALDCLWKKMEEEEQAEIQALEQFRDVDLAPLTDDDAAALKDEEEEDVDADARTPVKNAYKMYLRERMANECCDPAMAYRLPSTTPRTGLPDRRPASSTSSQDEAISSGMSLTTRKIGHARRPIPRLYQPRGYHPTSITIAGMVPVVVLFVLFCSSRKIWQDIGELWAGQGGFQE